MSETKFSSHLTDDMARRLILGTAQFGMSYGVTNRHGQVSARDVREILSYARDAGILLVDTAAGYGASEASLGECLPDFPEIGVVTKTAVIANPTIGVDEMRKIEDGVLHSVETLRRPRLDGLLVHTGSDLLKPGGETLAEYLVSLKSDGRVGRVGVSVYDASEIDRILEVFQPDIVQVPLNIFDQRLIRSGHIRALQSAGIEVHARSAFLQGILLAEPAGLPTYFQGFDRIFAKYFGFLHDTRLTPLAACMGFMMQQSGADRVIIGVTTRSELAGILAALPPGMTLPSMDMLACDVKQLIDPRGWPKLREDGEAARQ
ncbi:aldo/keto reductase [Afipia broomeae]|uniref:NADP-dependent oxidoreductase domain-containing protein n=1 Tax=Afipia broomeae ATCC 49717 TaxID=883078 RepID=K8P9V7_9BRAD|nr:aldo/keto reductase [Afipia broomeae]EKS36380.1 hypothetical protein HMPREF9695_02798 [Afipia broomeae ATCC 49717]